MIRLLDKSYVALKTGINAWFYEEDGDVNIVSIVVLIGVVVLLAIVFKDGIAKLIRTLLETITGTADGAVTTAPAKE